ESPGPSNGRPGSIRRGTTGAGQNSAISALRCHRATIFQKERQETRPEGVPLTMKTKSLRLTLRLFVDRESPILISHFREHALLCQAKNSSLTEKAGTAKNVSPGFQIRTLSLISRVVGSVQR